MLSMNCLNEKIGYRTHVEQVPNSNYLVSLHQREENYANFEIFDTSRQMQKVFSFGEIKGRIINRYFSK